MLKLSHEEVHLWLAFSGRIYDARELGDCLRLLSEPEKAQMNRFAFEKDRRRYLITRALVRRTLSRYLPVVAADWQFASNKYGRPEIAAVHRDSSTLSFNVSHTDGLIAMVVATGRTVGVDVENIAVRAAPLDIASNFFSAREAAALAALQVEEQPLRFFEYWTLKEAYIKARGLGLSIPLRKFGFSFPAENQLDFATDPDLGSDADCWAFWQLEADENYLLAVCAEKGMGVAPRLVCQPGQGGAPQSTRPRLRRNSRAAHAELVLPGLGDVNVGTI